MGILIRMTAIIIIVGFNYFLLKIAINIEKEKNNEDFKRRNEIHQLKEKLNEEKNDHQEEVEYLNNTINKLRTELKEVKSNNGNID